ncbi:MAG: ankyrin repeat domain-containing protein [Xenococcaceae cyanobacterium MO_167.B52]|nr:ankyrin repeat domain-containing protein [Xenococcaceae cyanobacterium MO_167.B52]
MITDPRLKGTEGICENPQKMNQYLQNAGDPNVKFYHLDLMHSGGGDWDEYTPLICSVLKSDEDNIKILINQGAELDYVNYRWSDKSLTALEQAILMGNIKITKLLIDSGASINFPEKEMAYHSREFPIFIAVKEGHQEIVELLIFNEVDIDIKDGYQKTPLDYAKDEDILNLLNKYYESKR